MNYIMEINEFYRWLDSHHMPSSAVNLYHAFMHINNSGHWKGQFTVALSTLCSKTGLDRKSVFKGREALTEMGRITWESKNSLKAAEYTIIPFFEETEKGSKGYKNIVPPDAKKEVKETDNVNVIMIDFPNEPGTDHTPDRTPDLTPECGTDHTTEQGTHSTPVCGTDHVPINKLKEKKLKEFKSNKPKGFLSSKDDDVDIIENVFYKYNEICRNMTPVRSITPKRRDSVGSRIREHGYEEVMHMLHMASRSKFLGGQNKSSAPYGFDWIFRPMNFVKVVEGNYEDRKVIEQPNTFGLKPSPLQILEDTYNNIVNEENC